MEWFFLKKNFHSSKFVFFFFFLDLVFTFKSLLKKFLFFATCFCKKLNIFIAFFIIYLLETILYWILYKPLYTRLTEKFTLEVYKIYNLGLYLQASLKHQVSLGNFVTQRNVKKPLTWTACETNIFISTDI